MGWAEDLLRDQPPPTDLPEVDMVCQKELTDQGEFLQVLLSLNLS